MKLMTILGTRPEIIRLAKVVGVLESKAQHVLVHTGQNYDDRLSAIFFEELGVRAPDVYLGIKGDTFGAQVGQLLSRAESLFLEHRPDRLLILGDTNSGLSALVARRLGIPVYHMEAGNRCFDDRVPEEVNRRIIDHCSSVLMPYTERSRQNLLREGIASDRIFVTGNPIHEVMETYRDKIDASSALSTLRLEPERYFLVTLHRAENVDNEARLRRYLDAFSALHRAYDYPVVCSLHPHTRARIESFGIDSHRAGLQFLPPFGFFDFVRLERSAFCVLSDSGTVQEETCLLNVPNVTLRDVTERPETVECGSNVLAGSEVAQIVALVGLVTSRKRTWTPPPEYLATSVTDTVCRLVLGYRVPDACEARWSARASSVS